MKNFHTKTLTVVLLLLSARLCGQNVQTSIQAAPVRFTTEALSTTDVTINEIMAANTVTAADQDGEFDDWIELYNKSNTAFDLSGWYLSDNPLNLPKWLIPTGTTIPAHGYLIVWADEDGTQTGLHANFKLSATTGEDVFLVDPQGVEMEHVQFGTQIPDKTWARYPNGTGLFGIRAPTFNASNGGMSPTFEALDASGKLNVFPNPANTVFTVAIEATEPLNLEIVDLLGQVMYHSDIQQVQTVDVAGWAAGMYIVRAGNSVTRVVVQ